jgi:hypothetical protein
MPYSSWAKGDYSTFYVVGSSPAVPNSIQSTLGATRISGANRFDVAYNMGYTAVRKGWLTNQTVAVANRLPDAITGGSAIGYMGGPILYTDAASLNARTSSYLATYKNDIHECYVLGGPKSVHESTVNQIRAVLK